MQSLCGICGPIGLSQRACYKQQIIACILRGLFLKMTIDLPPIHYAHRSNKMLFGGCCMQYWPFLQNLSHSNWLFYYVFTELSVSCSKGSMFYDIIKTLRRPIYRHVTCRDVPNAASETQLLAAYRLYDASNRSALSADDSAQLYLYHCISDDLNQRLCLSRILS